MPVDRDLNQFQTLSKNVSGGQYPNEHLFDYLDNRSKLDPRARNQMDIAEITKQLHDHPDQPEGLYLLAEPYLKSGKGDEAKSTIAQLDTAEAGKHFERAVDLLPEWPGGLSEPWAIVAVKEGTGIIPHPFPKVPAR